jgi:hypothetical protein
MRQQLLGFSESSIVTLNVRERNIEREREKSYLLFDWCFGSRWFGGEK